MTKASTGYSISYVNNDVVVTMTKAFAKKAGIYGSNEYKILMGIRKDMPEAKIVTDNSKAEGGTKRGMTYENMETVINQFDDKETRMAAFKRIRALSKIQPSPYKYVKEWFVKNYPNYDLDENGKVVIKEQEDSAK